MRSGCVANTLPPPHNPPYLSYRPLLCVFLSVCLAFQPISLVTLFSSHSLFLHNLSSRLDKTLYIPLYLHQPSVCLSCFLVTFSICLFDTSLHLSYSPFPHSPSIGLIFSQSFLATLPPTGMGRNGSFGRKERGCLFSAFALKYFVHF